MAATAISASASGQSAWLTRLAGPVVIPPNNHSTAALVAAYAAVIIKQTQSDLYYHAAHGLTHRVPLRPAHHLHPVPPRLTSPACSTHAHCPNTLYSSIPYSIPYTVYTQQHMAARLTPKRTDATSPAGSTRCSLSHVCRAATRPLPDHAKPKIAHTSPAARPSAAATY